MAFSRTELETCQAVQNTFQFLLETSSRVSWNWMILCNWILGAYMTFPGLGLASRIRTSLKARYFWLLLSGIQLKETSQFSWWEFFLLPPRMHSQECIYTVPILYRTALKRCSVIVTMQLCKEEWQLRVVHCVMWTRVSHPSHRTPVKQLGSSLHNWLST